MACVSRRCAPRDMRACAAHGACGAALPTGPAGPASRQLLQPPPTHDNGGSLHYSRMGMAKHEERRVGSCLLPLVLPAPLRSWARSGRLLHASCCTPPHTPTAGRRKQQAAIKPTTSSLHHSCRGLCIIRSGLHCMHGTPIHQFLASPALPCPPRLPPSARGMRLLHACMPSFLQFSYLL
jgi:hypothetical protein